MRITLDFDVTEEKLESRCAFLGMTLWSALWDIDMECRNRMKYTEGLSDEEYAFLDHIREMCHIATSRRNFRWIHH